MPVISSQAPSGKNLSSGNGKGGNGRGAEEGVDYGREMVFLVGTDRQRGVLRIAARRAEGGNSGGASKRGGSELVNAHGRSVKG